MWQRELKRTWGIDVVDPGTLVGDASVLWTSRCCRVKAERPGTPIELYKSHIPQNFLRTMESLGSRHAIVSDLYGLHFPDQALPPYDTPPGRLDTVERRSLGRKIGAQARKRGFGTLTFYNNSPILSRPYFEILSYVDLPVLFHTRLPESRK